ncbi:hypothetical protein WJX73_002580 [Symbiochloris irregularis]|uniref:leucine--tRNA ligase n=1 Tax=Symbiochloris irregularis TaxID=706552 RepID=A0AAW1NQS2_9CHLO
MAGEEKQRNTARLDQLLEIQAKAQASWKSNKVFEVDAPVPEDKVLGQKKFFGNFPFPYMNGLLHLGHAFSLSKLEFACAFHRLCGDRVLFPQAFHCTGMPIKACADKLDAELDEQGNRRPVTDSAEAMQAEVEDAAQAQPPQNDSAAAERDPAKFSSKKSKAAAKQGTATTQWGILASNGIPEQDIPKFRHPEHWLKYFPPKAVRDITGLGCGVDWRRSFITTDANPHFDAFVQWQMRTLKKRGYIHRDRRYAIYSPKDGQPCMDHDRASGEGVGPQEYTLIKMQALELPGPLAALKGKGTVFLLAATLRPETMYGQTNCWALPTGDYGAYESSTGEIYIVAARAARIMSYQDRFPETGKAEPILSVKGQDLLGVPLKAPNCPFDRIHVLPLLTISMEKGTGIVTSVPSDAPDDYAALMDLRNKPKLREKFGVLDEWVLPFEVQPIINIPGYGDKAAELMCQKLKISSQNDTKKLAEAKAEVYLKGFTHGTLIVGPHKGQPVQKVKTVIRDEMIKAAQAILYSEPEKRVVSRSGDECVVALTDQWFLTYGQDEWQARTRGLLESMETYGPDCRHDFEYALGWLEQWACSRSFGLGTRIPWDPQYLVESLSDSTIYMAYYTVCHLLQAGDAFTQTPGAEGVSPPTAEDLSDEVWDYVLLDGPLPSSTGIPTERLELARREFNYWYPFDLRASGKDLINNHLSFCLYTHTAIWQDRPDLWPRSMRCNGHLRLNNEKMSKSTGNFKTLDEAIRDFSADGVRIALAAAGDAMADANFEYEVADKAVLRLTKELAWIEKEVWPALAGLRTGPLEFLDQVFANELAIAAHDTHKAYEAMLFNKALDAGYYVLQNARDEYRHACGVSGMHRDLAVQYIKVSTLLLAPIAPHTCEHVWGTVLQERGSVLTAGWPVLPEPDIKVKAMEVYLSKTIRGLRDSVDRALLPPKARKGKAPAHVAQQVVAVDVYVADRFIGWQETALQFMALHLSDGSDVAGFGKLTGSLLEEIRTKDVGGGMSDADLKRTVIPFAKFHWSEALEGGKQMLDVTLPFDEVDITALQRVPDVHTALY